MMLTLKVMGRSALINKYDWGSWSRSVMYCTRRKTAKEEREGGGKRKRKRDRRRAKMGGRNEESLEDAENEECRGKGSGRKWN